MYTAENFVNAIIAAGEDEAFRKEITDIYAPFIVHTRNLPDLVVSEFRDGSIAAWLATEGLVAFEDSSDLVAQLLFDSDLRKYMHVSLADLTRAISEITNEAS